MERKLTAEEYHKLILSIVASATLCDHMGDMWDDLNHVLKEIGEEELEGLDTEDDLPQALHARGIQTVYGTDVGGEEDED